MKQWVCTNKEFLHKLSETASGKLTCLLVVLTWVLTKLQFGVVTDFSGQTLTFDGHCHVGEVRSSRMNHGFNDIGQMANIVYGVVWCEQFADVNVVKGLLNGGVMVCASINYRQRTQLHFNLWQFECTEIP
jgi:hypothetical protein